MVGARPRHRGREGVMTAQCKCLCDDHARCGHRASSYCSACLDTLCGVCYSVVQLGDEQVIDVCDACHDRLRAWANREDVLFVVEQPAVHGIRPEAAVARPRFV